MSTGGRCGTPSVPSPPAGQGASAGGDVAGWRWRERLRLRELREAMDPRERAAVGEAVAGHLETLLRNRFDRVGGLVVAGYWPIRSEPDLRPLMARLHAEGATVALPVVETRAAPLVFRRWTPGARLVRGVWNIPVPGPGAPEVDPGVVLAPCIGWDSGCYRLGYGGGYFDRTLAARAPRPFAVGIALAGARIATIHPQPHDIPLDAVVTESGVGAVREHGA